MRDGAVYLDVDPIELIETHPRAPLRQPPEELPHHLVVDLIRAVEHHAQDADSLGEVEFETQYRQERKTARQQDDKRGRGKAGTERAGRATPLQAENRKNRTRAGTKQGVRDRVGKELLCLEQ